MKLREFKKLVDDIRKYHKHEAQAFIKPTSDTGLTASTMIFVLGGRIAIKSYGRSSK